MKHKISGEECREQLFLGGLINRIPFDVDTSGYWSSRIDGLITGKTITNTVAAFFICEMTRAIPTYLGNDSVSTKELTYLS
jgi:hypothetical protein